MSAALVVLAVQGLLGALDNLLHHELEARLPSRRGARRELLLHACREAIYGLLFVALAWTQWEGALAWVIVGLLGVEVVITILDFLEEDRTRSLPPFERVLHTVLAVSYGTFLATFAPEIIAWASRPTAITFADHGLLSVILTAYAGPVLIWSARNALAARALRRRISYAVRSRGRTHSGRTVLVTGATGFLGRGVVRALLAEGAHVIVLTRDMRAARSDLGPSVLALDRLDALPHTTIIDGVVNLAGAPILGGLWTARRKRTLLNSRLDVTWHVIRLIDRLERKPEVLVNASAIGYYGVRDDTPLDEEAALGRGFQADLCHAWEEAAMSATALGVRTVALRFGLVFGRDGGVAPILLRAAALGLGARIGTGRQIVSWVHYHDAVSMIMFAMNTPALTGVVNATSPSSLTQGELAARMSEGFSGRVRLVVPSILLRWVLGELAELVVDGQNAKPVKALAAGFHFRYPDFGAALTELISADQEVSCARVAGIR
jgi:uncharacterized protein (TIGR01777 family)